MRLQTLVIRYVTWPSPDHWEGTIEYKDENGGSKIELRLTSEQVEGLFPVVADALIQISHEAANVLKSTIIREVKQEEPITT